MLTAVLDAAATKAFMEKFKSNITVSTIESGKQVWDVAKFCAQNTEKGHSVCDSAPSFLLQLILRASNVRRQYALRQAAHTLQDRTEPWGNLARRMSAAPAAEAGRCTECASLRFGA